MNRQLKEISDKFKVSEPIFVARISEDCRHIDFKVKEQYRPDPTAETDPVAKLIAKNYRENFDTSRGEFVQSTSLDDIYREIVDDVKAFFDNNSPLRNPSQSKMYKWLRNAENSYNENLRNGFIALYRYTNGNDLSDAEIKNVLAILELMKEKYEDKQQDPH